MNKTESGRKSSCPHGTACNSVSKRSSGAAASRIVRDCSRVQQPTQMRLTDRHEARSLKNAACPLEMMYVYSTS